MASIDKYTDTAAFAIIGHVDRSLNYEHMSNQDIAFERSHLNEQLSPERDCTSYEYYQKLIQGCYVYGRNDVKTLAGVIITLPHDTPQEYAGEFFRLSYEFLNERYCGQNAVVSCQVHNDEAVPHMHYLFVPVTRNTDKRGQSRYVERPADGPDTRREVEKYPLKISASDVLTRQSYLTFHDDFQRFLNEHGCPGTVKSGVTAAQGRSMTVRELKRETPLERHQREELIRRNSERPQERNRFGGYSEYDRDRRF